ncbi:pilus assembly protein [Pseudohalocynthiibacter aestuariivivens]|uniref:Pilus assembly protein n=1 Tax=Roseovarius pelagicus TaxID=2980108 RepID=A0ABY6D9T2_9RHOB|nr:MULTISPECIES: pilus assembly protein [Rhodobacterales]QIE45167.1 pilus assembly protein [Pseudohalocynthiibacter aestuariivivens]UXX82896.1 pilus assembly protein [Roseovarius pelagicus]
MYTLPLIQWFKRFRDDETGTVTLETVLTLPLLFWALAATYEFFELHRYNSARDKASYTIADMISREMQTITPTYLDSAKTVFDTMTNDEGDNQMRISVVKYDADSDQYAVRWSQVRGDGTFDPLTNADVRNSHETLPVMRDGEEVIVMESRSTYPPIFDVGINDGMMIETRVLTSPRFAPQIVWENE